MIRNQPIRMAVVGCGVMVGGHIRGYRAIAEKTPGLFEVVATCDVDESRARAAAEKLAAFQTKHPPRVYTDYDRMLAELMPDAVDLILPHGIHHTAAAKALAAGAHVLLEKPLGITIAAGHRILDALAYARKSGRRVLASGVQGRYSVQWRMYHWAINEAKLIGEPRLGLMQRITGQRNVVAGTPWRHQRLLAGGGWMLDGEVHRFHLLRYLFGEVKEVYARLRNYEPTRFLDTEKLTGPVPSDVEDTAMAVLTFESGLMVMFNWTTAAPGREWSHWRYYGSDGCVGDEGLGLRDGTQKSPQELEQLFWDALTPERKETFFPYGMTEPLALELYDFGTAVRDGRPNEIDGEWALSDLAVSEAVYESDYARQPVQVADVRSGRLRAAQRDVDERWGLL